ncbi:hypothetical protein K503DRAFT_785715 [Rhizopogon vinicolor AM-OR11-026]|uniref:Uncharacterized protein n=1 Tax=Rhizopogon vinicolor AM-OR11-026 TaxID=1314800 RepID=A0A1B7MPI2_9AGAM|nr:hypothetical protein K503DRAFT_785715 [Rhizopogon vinicolor AM-OR11-026]
MQAPPDRDRHCGEFVHENYSFERNSHSDLNHALLDFSTSGADSGLQTVATQNADKTKKHGDVELVTFSQRQWGTAASACVKKERLPSFYLSCIRETTSRRKLEGILALSRSPRRFRTSGNSAIYDNNGDGVDHAPTLRRGRVGQKVQSSVLTLGKIASLDIWFDQDGIYLPQSVNRNSDSDYRIARLEAIEI